MRIGPPPEVIQPYVRAVHPVDAEPLSPEVSQKLISSGVFDSNPNQTVWATAMHGGLLAPGKGHSPSASVELPGGIRFQPLSTPPTSDSLLATMLDVGKQSLPVLENSGGDVIADSVAVFVSSPEVLHALASPDRSKPENIFRYGTNLVKLLNIANNFVHVPHGEESLAVAAIVFKAGEQVFIAREENAVQK